MSLETVVHPGWKEAGVVWSMGRKCSMFIILETLGNVVLFGLKLRET